MKGSPISNSSTHQRCSGFPVEADSSAGPSHDGWQSNGNPTVHPFLGVIDLAGRAGDTVNTSSGQVTRSLALQPLA